MSVEITVLGAAQDGGLPHPGCRCANCEAAREDSSLRRRVACLGVRTADGRGLLVDATPDLPDQVSELPEFSGLLLTHAHMGHVAGLIWLGVEAMAVKGLPVWLGAELLEHLRGNEPWGMLIREGFLDPRVIESGMELQPAAGLTVTPLRVEHRAEWSETFAFRLRGTEKTILWLPDIDRFDDETLAGLLAGVDLAFLDGTFWSADDLPGRNLEEIPHPFIQDTLESLARTRPAAAVSFVHLNHSNPLWNPDSAERRELLEAYDRAGLAWVGPSPVAEQGLTLAI